jgi:heterotetrameric sarcosine oxidase gamma subunit
VTDWTASEQPSGRLEQGFEFLSPGPSAVARSPMERQAMADGGRFERRDGWNVAVRFDGDGAERARLRDSVGFSDLTHLGKVEIQASRADLAAIVAAAAGGEVRLELGKAARGGGAWWCPYTPERAIVLCEPAELAGLRDRLLQAAARSTGLSSVIDVTTTFAALAVAGPLARETFARFTAIDLRPALLPPNGFRPGSVARTPGAVLRMGEDRFLMLFGFALGQYMWTVVADAAGHLGGGPVGVDALEPVDAPVAGVSGA